MSVIAYVQASDVRIAERLWRWRPGRLVRLVAILATRLGDGWAWAFAALVLACGDGRCLEVLAAASLAVLVANVVQVALKRGVRRQRPCVFQRHPSFPRVQPPDRFSFPSGHTLNAFAVTLVLALEWPHLALPLLAVAAAIGASRVVLGMHYTSDVLAGALIGASLGIAAWGALLA